MATAPRPRFEELPAEEPEALISIPEARREQSIEAVREAGNSDALFYAEANSSVAAQRINDPQFIDNLAAQYPELSRNEVQAEYAYGVSQYGLNLNVEAMEPAADRVQMLTRGRELFEQENFDGNTDGRWTLQQFSTNPAGEPWMALQERDDAGDVQRTFTGSRAEMETLISENKLTATELPPITEGEYYRQAMGRMGLEPEIRQEEGFSVSV